MPLAASSCTARISSPTDVPVLLLVSSDDRSVRPALLEGIEAFASSFERCELSGGHWLPRSRPAEVAAAIRRHTTQHAAG